MLVIDQRARQHCKCELWERLGMASARGLCATAQRATPLTVITMVQAASDRRNTADESVGMCGQHTQSDAVAALVYGHCAASFTVRSNSHGGMLTASWSECSASHRAQKRGTNSRDDS
jgi:hypothetical protein